MPEDPFDNKQFRRYADHVRRELIPMIQDSAVTVSILPSSGEADVKFAVELGFMIMLDKPIIAVVGRGAKCPAKLVTVADEIVEGSVDEPDFQERFMAAVDRVTKRITKKEGLG